MAKRRKTGFAVVLGAACLLCGTGAARAQPSFTVNIIVDENGNGLFTNSAGERFSLPAALQDDPGPGGLAGALTYSLSNPPGLTDGDVLLEEPGGGLSDLIRFNPAETCAADGSSGCLVCYSDNEDGKDSLADSGTPDEFNDNQVVLTEVGPEGHNGAVYTPTEGQPGFVAGAPGTVVTYAFFSDGTFVTPEPASLGMLLAGLFGLGLARRRKRA